MGSVGVRALAPTTARIRRQSQNPPQFGFWHASGTITGNYFIDVLVPNNVVGPSSYSFTYSNGGVANSNLDVVVTATLFSATAWTSGQLDTYLGIAASPTNPIGAYLPTAQTFQPSATGFLVYQVELGPTTLQPNADRLDGPLFSAITPFAKGSYVVGFVSAGEKKGVTQYSAIPNSGAILETGTTVTVPGPLAGTGIPGLVLAFGSLMTLWRIRRRMYA